MKACAQLRNLYNKVMTSRLYLIKSEPIRKKGIQSRYFFELNFLVCWLYFMVYQEKSSRWDPNM